MILIFILLGSLVATTTPLWSLTLTLYIALINVCRCFIAFHRTMGDLENTIRRYL